jgi:hypothetical protein
LVCLKLIEIFRSIARASISVTNKQRCTTNPATDAERANGSVDGRIYLHFVSGGADYARAGHA